VKTVREIMHTDLLTATPEETLGTAAGDMGSRRVSCVLVLDGERLAGILTERDVVRAVATYFDASKHPVKEWMSSDPVIIGPSATENEALDLMLERGIRHLPVIDEHRLVGVISIRDVSHHARG
jgi:CBS domain-containing protein